MAKLSDAQKKLSSAQIKALRYFDTLKLVGKFPTKQVQGKLFDLGLLGWVEVENPLYKGPEGLHSRTMCVTRITDLGRKALAQASK